jgi:hypothetical protein
LAESNIASVAWSSTSFGSKVWWRADGEMGIYSEVIVSHFCTRCGQSWMGGNCVVWDEFHLPSARNGLGKVCGTNLQREMLERKQLL